MAESAAAQTPHEAALDALGIDREEHQRGVDELVKRNEQLAATTEPRTIGCMRARRVTIRLRRKRGLTAEYVTDIIVPAAWKRGTLLRYVRHSHPEETVKIVEWHDTGGWTATAWLPNPAAFTNYRSGALA